MSLSVFQAAQDAPTALAVLIGETRLTYAALAEQVELRIAELAPRGAAPLPLLALPNLQSLTTLFACLELRIPVVPINPRLPPDQLARRSDEASRFCPVGEEGDEKPVAFVYTSGSSGTPRAVELSRRAFLAAARSSAAWLGWEPDDRWLLAMSFAHVGGLSILIRCLQARRPVVVATSASFSPAETAALLRRERVTLASLVPTQLALLLESGEAPPPALRAVLLGGASAGTGLRARAAAAGWPTLTTYGLTETCAQVATQRPGTTNASDLAVGEALPGVELRIVDGNIEVRSPSLLTAYHPPDVHPLPLLPGGWFRTGDLGSLDAAGMLQVLGRSDDVIVTGGEKVLPAEVETALEACDGVAAACVFGVDDPLWGKIVVAAIVPKGPGFNAGAVANALQLKLATFQRPRQFALLDSLPLTATGKIDRRQVAAAASGKLSPLTAG